MDHVKVFLLSAMPVVELRGGFPLGVLLGLPRWEALFVSIMGNISIILPWLLVLMKLERYLSRVPLVRNAYAHMLRRAEGHRAAFKKYGKLALFFLVAIPLPGTGAWTGCVASRLFRLSLWESFTIIAAGVVAAGIIMLAAKIMALSFFWPGVN